MVSVAQCQMCDWIQKLIHLGQILQHAAYAAGIYVYNVCQTAFDHGFSIYIVTFSVDRENVSHHGLCDQTNDSIHQQPLYHGSLLRSTALNLAEE